VLEFVADSLLNVVRCVALAMVAITPWAFGGVSRGFQVYLFWAAGLGIGLWMAAVVLRLGQTESRVIRVPWMLIPLCAAIVLGAVQLLPLGKPASEVVATDVLQRSATLSFYPASTRLDLAGLVLATVLFAIGAWLFQDRRTQLWLWGTLALNGAALAFFGIAQKLSWNGRLFWTVEVTSGGQPFASFVNRNNSAGFLNLCLAAAIGLLAWTMQHDVGQGAQTHPVRERWRLKPAWGASLLAGFGKLTTWQLAAGVCATLIMAGIWCSLSRGGILSMAGAGLITAVAFVRQHRNRLPVMAASVTALALSICLLSWLGLQDSVEGRLATLNAGSLGTDARLRNWRDALGAVRDFGLGGTGLGTYRYVYLPYERTNSTVWFHHAENQYLEALIEAGAAGLALMLAAIGLMALAILGLLRSTSLRNSDGVAFVGLFALAAQCLHAVTDFGLYVPANLLAFALICGAVAGRAGRLQVRGTLLKLPASWYLTPRLVGLLALAGILSNEIVGLNEVSAAAATDAAGLKTDRLAEADSYTATELDAHLNRLQLVLPQRPDDALLHRALAQLWIYRYRQQAFAVLQAHAESTLTDAEQWRATDLGLLHREVNRLRQAGDQPALQKLVEDPLIQQNLVPALRHLQAAQACCPLLSNLDLPLAALAFLQNPQSPEGAVHIQHSALIAPSDPDVLFQAGALASQAGLEELAWNLWRRSLQLEPRSLSQVLTLANGKVTIPQLLDKLLPDSPELLLGLARGDASIQVGDAERASLVQRAKQLLTEQKGHSPDARWHYASAGLLRLENHPEAATDAYRLALRLKPDAQDWRREFAEFLEREDKIDEALQQARLCAWAAPDNAGVQQLVVRLNRTKLQRPQSKPQ
jgi:O-antigen ligase